MPRQHRPLPRGIDDEARSVLNVLADLARAFALEEPGGTVARWLDWLPSATRDRNDPEPASGAVTLCSFHRAKGLEWDAVWIAGVEQGLVPIGRAYGEEAEAEERRLLYVALTRAATELHCSWARMRTFGGRSVARDPSPWLAAIAVDCGTQREGARPPSAAQQGVPPWRERLAEQKRTLRDQRPGRCGRAAFQGFRRATPTRIPTSPTGSRCGAAEPLAPAGCPPT